MEIIANYGILLEPLGINTIETVRMWRNQIEVSQFMEFRNEISKEEQLIWFEKIQKTNSEYYIIKKEEHQIGLIHLNQIDNTSKSAEAGLFIGNPKFNGTGITLGASILLLEHAFNKLGLENIFAKVKNCNDNAIKYNKLLGFIEDKPHNSEFTIYKLKKEKFYNSKSKLINLLQ